MTYKTRQPFPHAAYVEGQRNFTYFDRSLTSGLTDVVIESPGDFLYIDQASTGVVSVELNMRQGGTLAPILLAAGGSIECDFASLKLNAAAQTNKTVRVIVGNGARIKGGANVNPSSAVVSTVDGGQYATNDGKAFLSTLWVAPVAAKYGHVQLMNPSGSEKNVKINRCTVSASAAAGVIFGFYATPLTILAVNGIAKKANAPASTAQIRSEHNGTSLISAIAYALQLPAASSFPFVFNEPVLLPPGYGFIVQNQAVNQDLAVNFDFIEE